MLLEVRDVRFHDTTAEVTIGIVVNGSPFVGWQGVAVREGGRWRVARSTFCALLDEWGPSGVRCDGVRPGTFWLGTGNGLTPPLRPAPDGGTTAALTFPDGSTADVALPAAAGSGWVAVPQQVDVLLDAERVPVGFHRARVVARQPVLDYPGPGGRPVVYDAQLGLVVRGGQWTAAVDVARLSERRRAEVARHLSLRTTADGFPQLRPTGPLHFTRDGAVPAKGPELAIEPGAVTMSLEARGGGAFLFVGVDLGPCPAPAPVPQGEDDGGVHAVGRCLPGGGIYLRIEGGDAEIVDTVAAAVTVDHVVRPTPKTHATAAA